MKTGLGVVGLPRVDPFDRTHNPKVAGSNPAPATNPHFVRLGGVGGLWAARSKPCGFGSRRQIPAPGTPSSLAFVLVAWAVFGQLARSLAASARGGKSLAPGTPSSL